MNKKLISLVLSSIMVISMFTGCQSDANTDTDTDTSTSITSVEDLSGKTLGAMGSGGFTDSELLSVLNGFYDAEFKEIKAYDSEASLIMALDTDKIDAVIVRDFQAKMYSKDSDKYNMFSTDNDKTLKGSARMVAANDTDAATDMTKVNDALAQLKADGTLDALQEEYIDNFDFTKNYDSIEMPVIADAVTYKVSVSGSMAPLDYIAADGESTGYSIALLSKISEIAGINFELVTVGMGTDTLELNSNKIDYIFCYTLTDASMAKGTMFTFSDAYYAYEGTAFLVKK